MRPSKKDQLVDTAILLFSRHGYHATGIDTILAEAGVAKMTLYNNFGSKEALIVAALEKRDEEHISWLVAEVEARAESPTDRLLAFFDALEVWFAEEEFHGCPFLKASAEFDDPADPIHQVALSHKGRVLALIREMVAVAGVSDPVRLSGEIYMLVEGATVVAQLTGDLSTASRARRAADALIAAA